MAEPGFLGSTDITMDDGSMDVNARSIDEKMSKLSNNLSSLPPDESTSVKNAFKRIDTEVQGQIESLTEFF